MLFIIIVMLIVLKGNPYEIHENAINAAPSLTHFFGTDALGRDVFSRTVVGAGYSLIMLLVAVAIAIIIGVGVGTISSLTPRWLGDKIILVLDFMNSLPSIVYILLAVSFIEPTFWTIPLIIGFCSWMTIARQVRMTLLKEQQQPYIQMAKQIETSWWHRLRYYYLPALYPVLGITAIHEAIHVLFAEATISFLGFGLAVNTPTLGNLLTNAQSYFLMGAWWNILFPGLFIAAITYYFLHIKKSLLWGGERHVTSKRSFRLFGGKLYRKQRNISNKSWRENHSYREKWDW